MADSQVMQKIEQLTQQREEIRAREDTHHAGPEDQRTGENIDHALEVLWDLRRREMSGENIELDEDFLDHYSVDPGDAPPVANSRKGGDLMPDSCGLDREFVE